MQEHNEGASTLSTVTPATIKNAFTEIMNDEAAHVTFFQKALTQAKASPRPKPTFKGLAQANQRNFATMSRTLENTGIAAFLMAMPAISNQDYTAAAASILLGQPLSEIGAFDKAASHAEIITAVSPFIESLNGGPDPADELNNDIVILNFALLLEYLEAEFYGINVPNLFK